MEAVMVPYKTVTVAAADLPAYISSLPRLLTENLTISVTGTATVDYLTIEGLYGSGSIIIQVNEGAELTIYGTVYVLWCSVPLTFNGIKFVHNDNQDTSTSGFIMQGGGTAVLMQCQFKHYFIALNCWNGCIVYALNCACSDNTNGGKVHGGILLLQGTTPDLMGGFANLKEGGIIVKSDGTLL